MSKQPYSTYASVILDQMVGKNLDYGIKDCDIASAVPGARVQVPLRGKLCYGYIAKIKDTPDFLPVQPIAKICSEGELITPELFSLAQWIADYYCAPLNKAIKTILPATVRKENQHKEQLQAVKKKGLAELQSYCASIRSRHPAQAEILDQILKAKEGIFLSELLEMSGCSRSPVDSLVRKGLIALEPVRVDRSPLVEESYFRTEQKKLNCEQAAALAAVCETLDSDIYKCHLLFGITGSGKTEVYLQAIAHALSQGKGTIILVPEIALTEQTIERFRSRFEVPLAILHHRLSEGERFDSWHKIRKGEVNIVIGARSAIFAPLPNLGLIIVDEEHEGSYKQCEESPCYHARDVAVMRGSKKQAAVILGSATPSLESYHNALTGKYALSTLTSRAGHAAMLPTVKIVSMKQEFERAGGYTTFSDALIKGIKERFKSGEQTILFLNRRGYHTSLICSGCGDSMRCTCCDVALTFHKKQQLLRCHLCGYQVPPPSCCPSCREGAPLQFRGIGTEQVEAALHALFPDLRTTRLDADTTRHKGGHQRLLRAFATGKADVMIGTQMIAKGLHFPSVTLVGVLNSDAALNIPDYRASESVFQLITQVAGRAGRGHAKGEVIIQTLMPDNRTIALAAAQDYVQFYQEEVAIRKCFGYPPTSKMAKVSISGSDQSETHEFALEAREAIARKLPPQYEVYPVDPSGYAKIKNRYRYHFLIKGPSTAPIGEAFQRFEGVSKKKRDLAFYIDINPLTTF